MSDKKVYRNSHQREVILEELKGMKSHPTSNTLFKLVSKRLPNISLGTVYRNLDLLSKTGVIQKLEVGGLTARYDGDTDKHFHICCTDCGRIDDVFDLPENLINIDLSMIKGYAVKGYQMNFFGVCQICRENH